MVKFSISSFATIASLLASTAVAQDVLCLVNGNPVATVDLQTANCPFTLPDNLPVFFDFVSPEDFNIEFYYALAQNQRYFNDIVNAGRVIEIPAIALYGTPGAPLYQVHVQESPASNSTAALRKRLFKQVDIVKRDEASDLAESLKSQDGTLVSSGFFQVVDISSGASSVAVSSGIETIPGATATETLESTKIITITSCSDNKCTPTAVPATPAVTTATIDGTITSYTTYCPISSTATETLESTKIITITSCSDNKCTPTAVPATPAVTTATIDGTITSYTTYCPISSTATETLKSTKIITITSCSADKCAPTTVPATEGLTTETIEGAVTTYTTWCPVSSTKAATEAATSTKAATEAATATKAAPTVETLSTSTVAPGATSSTAAISTYEGSASSLGKSLFALALIPLAYLI